MHFVNAERINKVVIHFKSSSICVSPGFGSLIGEAHRRYRSGQTSGHMAVRPTTATGSCRRFSAVRAINLDRSDRRQPGGQTGASTSVRPRSDGHSV